MNIDKLQLYYNIEDNGLFKFDLFNPFSITYIEAKQKSEYKLYHTYIFRSKLALESYKRIYGSNTINLHDPNVLRHLDVWSSTFIGYFKNKKRKKYNELFLHLCNTEDINNNPICDISGYSINGHEINYQYMFEDPIDLGYTYIDPNINIKVSSDIVKHISSLKKYCISLK